MSQRERNNPNNDSAHGGAKQRHQPRQTQGGEHSRAHHSGVESSVDSDFRVMRCFCGCTALTYEQIEHFSTMNVSALITNKTGKNLLRNFLRIGYQHDKSEAMLHLECFVMCNKFLRNSHMLQDQDMIEHLFSLCPSYSWEQKITDALQNPSEIREVLNDLKHECVHSIECHNDYDRFRRELLRKIGKS